MPLANRAARRVGRQQGHRDYRQPPLQSDRINKKLLGPVEAVNRDVVVERAGLLDGDVFGDRGDVRTGASRSISIRWACPARTSRCLARYFITVIAGSLIGRADHFDRGDQSVLATPAAVDLKERSR